VIGELVARWGYPAVVLGTFFEGETVLLIGGAMAHRGLLTLPGVIVAAFVGSVAGDQLWFLVGKRWGLAVIERRPSWRDRVGGVERWLARYGSAFVVGFRFIYGLRTISPLILGATGYPQRRFAWLNVIGAALWAATFAGLGWGLGEGLRRTIGRSARWEELGLLAVGLAAAVTLVHHAVAKRASSSGDEHA
jgi:membrane protein DedA with SNARE-associated domain